MFSQSFGTFPLQCWCTVRIGNTRPIRSRWVRDNNIPKFSGRKLWDTWFLRFLLRRKCVDVICVILYDAGVFLPTGVHFRDTVAHAWMKYKKLHIRCIIYLSIIRKKKLFILYFISMNEKAWITYYTIIEDYLLKILLYNCLHNLYFCFMYCN